MKRTKFIILVLLTVAIVGSLSSCVFNCVRGSGNQATEERKANDFKRIDVSGGFKVVLKQDSSLALKITADDNLLKYIKTTVDDGRLHIFTRRNICNAGQMTISIGVRNLEEIKASGAVEIESDGKINTQDFNISLSGATKVTMELNAANVTTRGSG